MNTLELFRATCRREATPHLPCQPITMQFSSRLIGRRFLDFVQHHEVMVEAQMAMVEEFGIGCLQTISDPCREVHDLGGRCIYFEDEAPACDARFPLLAEKTALASLSLPDPLGGGRMHDRIKAIAAMRARVGQGLSVQGWVEGPIAMAVDLRGMDRLMLDTVDDPAFVMDLFEFSVAMAIDFAREQIAAGADTIGIGDAAASLISPATYEQLVLPYEARLAQAIRELGGMVRLHICGNTTHLVGFWPQLAIDLADIDHLCDLNHARREAPELPILGNIDPTSILLQGNPETVTASLAACHQAVGPGFLVGAGCEVPKHTPHENLHALVRYAREHRGLAAC